MKVIIAGTRDMYDLTQVEEAVAASGFEVEEVVSGGARGADAMGEVWAVNSAIPVKKFPADWNAYGKRAGFIRNQEMASYADALIAIWDGMSRGTADMIKRAEDSGLKIYVHIYV